MTDSPLTEQQLKFIDEYLIDQSVGKAAIRAGYKADWACSQGSRLLADPRVKAALAEARKDLGDRLGITPERVLRELALIGFANLKDYVTTDEDGDTDIDLSSLSREQAGALAIQYEVVKGKHKTKVTKVKQADKTAALLAIAKYLGMAKETVEHTGKLTLEQLVESSLKEEDRE